MNASVERIGLAAIAGLLAAPVLAVALFTVGLVPIASWAVAVAAAGVVAAFLPRHLPPDLDGILRRRPVLSIAWLVFALLAVLQVVRVAATMIDPLSQDFLIPDNLPAHSCLTAHVRAVRLLLEGGRNIYDPRYYLEAAPETELFEQDDFIHPPPFLLVARILMVFSQDFFVVRQLWFIFHAVVAGCAIALVPRWLGGRAGWAVALLSPLLVISFPVTGTLQIGNGQLYCLALAVLGMVFLDEKKPVVGGALLALSVFTKVFPVFLVAYLFFRKRWRDVAWTCGWMVGVLGLSIAVLGWRAFHDYVTFGIPRTEKFGPFAYFFEHVHLILPNVSLYGFVAKLKLLGAGVDPLHAKPFALAYTALMLGLTFVGARRAGPGVGAPDTRTAEGQRWLAILTLGTLQSPNSPAAYAMLGPIWLVLLIAPSVAATPRAIAAYVALWVAALYAPLDGWPLAGWVFPFSPTKGPVPLFLALTMQIGVVALAAWALVRRAPSATSAAPAPAPPSGAGAGSGRGSPSSSS